MGCQLTYSISDVDLLERKCALEAQRSFYAYRQYMRPKMKKGWWQRAIAGHLQKFYFDYKFGLRPVLVIQAPPQHGKSEQITDFISWMAGKNPNDKAIFASFSERLGIRTNLALQRIYTNRKYKNVFPDTQINGSNIVTVSGEALRNREILEYLNADGYFRNTTVGGSVTGESLDIGVIDDPVKGREAANSKTIRNKTWEWFTDDFYSRFADHAGLLIILTRWHMDDVVGRLLEQDENIKLLSYPALATKDKELMPDDPRVPGSDEPLFPEHKSKSFLLQRQSIMLPHSWESVYQQSPIHKEACWMEADKLEIGLPGIIKQSVRYWDKAGTKDAGCYSAGVLVGVDNFGVYWILDIERGQWAAPERERVIKQVAQSDGTGVRVWVEQEPGSGGKESAESTVRNLAGYSVFKDLPTGDKEARAEPLAVQISAGNVKLKRADWNQDFIDEVREFPAGTYKDQVDAAAGAFIKLTSGKVAGTLRSKK